MFSSPCYVNGSFISYFTILKDEYMGLIIYLENSIYAFTSSFTDNFLYTVRIPRWYKTPSPYNFNGFSDKPSHLNNVTISIPVIISNILGHSTWYGKTKTIGGVFATFSGIIVWIQCFCVPSTRNVWPWDSHWTQNPIPHFIILYHGILVLCQLNIQWVCLIQDERLLTLLPFFDFVFDSFNHHYFWDSE